jgi:hypothetical protein
VTNPGAWTWILLFLLGAYHGINPSMGWLFAVALGLQRQDSKAVWLSLIPIALGHVVAIGVAVGVAAVAGMVFPLLYVKISVALLLIGFGAYRIAGRGHVRWGGMQAGFKDLATWSFLMASAHGAGLMLLPIVLGMSGSHQGHTPHAGHFALSGGIPIQLLAVAVHTCGYLLLTGLAAWIVYAKFGVALLRKAWFNLDLIWAFALIATACLTLFISS